MTVIQAAVTGVFIFTGAYAGLCAGQLTAYLVTRAVLKRSGMLDPTEDTQEAI